MTKPLQDAKQITAKTLSHYDENADAFWVGTRDHDVAQNVAALLRYISSPAPLRILDLGCGPGRDLIAFRDRGHDPVGLEGSAALANLARQHSKCEVWEQDFVELDLPARAFDGIFANASLFHVPSTELPQVLEKLHRTLKADGVLFSSNPRGDNEQGFNGMRYGAYYDLETWSRLLNNAGFSKLEHYYRPPGLPLQQQPWLASVWRKGLVDH